MKVFWELYSTFFKIGAPTFGGGYAMLPMIEREIVEKKKWATFEEVMDYFAIAQCTPGVIAVNCATFIGHKIKGVIGGIVATIGVVTPSVIIISVIASILKTLYENPIAKHAFAGISIAVCALLLQAFMKLSKAGVKNKFGLVLAIAAFISSMFLKLSPIIIVLIAGAIGIVYSAVKEKTNKKQGVEK